MSAFVDRAPGADTASLPAARAYLHPGEVVLSATPTVLSTILGSCVAVCLFSRGGAGGMNHYLLPRWTSGEATARFGNVAVRRLIEGLVGLGCPPSDLRHRDLLEAALGVQIEGSLLQPTLCIRLPSTHARIIKDARTNPPILIL